MSLFLTWCMCVCVCVASVTLCGACRAFVAGNIVRNNIAAFVGTRK